jgi:hypothetical protein
MKANIWNTARSIELLNLHLPYHNATETTAASGEPLEQRKSFLPSRAGLIDTVVPFLMPLRKTWVSNQRPVLAMKIDCHRGDVVRSERNACRQLQIPELACATRRDPVELETVDLMGVRKQRI